LPSVLVVLALVAAWGGLGPEARASDIPKATDGEGIKVGERSTFHAGFALSYGVDTNVFSEASQETPRAASYFYPAAWVGIGNRAVRDGLLMSPPERSGRIADYSLAVVSGFRQYLSTRDYIRQVPRFTLGAQARFGLLPGRRVSINFAEDFFRGANPANLELRTSLFNFNRIQNRALLGIVGRPGGGRLSLEVAYINQVLRFSASQADRNNRLIHGLLHETKWRFLPKSSLVFRYTFDFTFYTECCTEVGLGRNEDNYAHRLQGGYRGLVGKKIALEALAGWGFGYYRDDANGPSFNSLIGELGLSYFPTMRSLVHLGVFRSFNDSVFGNYFVDNGARLALRHQFRWRMIGDLGGAVFGRTYHGLPDPGVEDQQVLQYVGRGAPDLQARTTMVTINAGLEQPLGRLFSLGLRYTLLVDSTNFQVIYADDDINHLGSIRHLVWIMGAVRI
jgi:hypothetical protein